MTTCPQCGRVADDEFVCAQCGAFLAAEREDGQTGDVPVRRVALLAILVCLLALGAAAVLLRQGGGGRTTGLGAPLSTAPISQLPLGAPSRTNATEGSSRTGASSTPPLRLTSSATASTASSSASASSSARATASRTSPATTTSAPRPSSSRPPSTSAPASHSTSPRPSTSSPPSSVPPPPPAVGLAKGAACGQHCYSLVVSLRNFPAGQHTVTCWSDPGRQFGSYSTSASTSTGCSYNHPNAAVWVVVDGHRSNTVTW